MVHMFDMPAVCACEWCELPANGNVCTYCIHAFMDLIKLADNVTICRVLAAGNRHVTIKDKTRQEIVNESIKRRLEEIGRGITG